MTTSQMYSIEKTGFLSVSRVIRFSSRPVLDPDCGEPFDIVPDESGVLIMVNESGVAISIESCEFSMRKRLLDHYKGIEGKATASATWVAYEPCSSPSVREAELVLEHQIQFGYVPLANRA